MPLAFTDLFNFASNVFFAGGHRFCTPLRPCRWNSCDSVNDDHRKRQRNRYGRVREDSKVKPEATKTYVHS